MSVEQDQPDAVLIAGPTASGKSRLALDMARRWDGEIINTDSMQVYPLLQVLTARPSEAEMEGIPHHLYGHAPLDEPYSVARWVEDVRPVLADIRSRNKVPIFVGGTGLYFTALLKGLASVPPIDPKIREDVRARLDRDGAASLHTELQRLDEEGAASLRPSDGQRIARALEVVLSTGRPLSDHHRDGARSALLSELLLERMLVLPERDILHERINARSQLMIEQGAIDEVVRLNEMKLPEKSTALKAIGVPQISAYLAGMIDQKDMIDRLQAATRQYAKRQSTWFRNQLDASWRKIM